MREVTAQRRQAERAAAEVFAILESQGFSGHLLSDADDDSGSDQDDGADEEEGAKSRGDAVRATGAQEAAAQGEAEDAQSGTAQSGGLSWKGRSVSPRKARQLKHKHRRSYFYLLSSSDSSSPKYRMGQSCRKNKRQMVTRCRAAVPKHSCPICVHSYVSSFLPDTLFCAVQQWRQVGITGRGRRGRGESEGEAARWVVGLQVWRPRRHGRRGGWRRAEFR